MTRWTTADGVMRDGRDVQHKAMDESVSLHATLQSADVTKTATKGGKNGVFTSSVFRADDLKSRGRSIPS